MVTVTVKGIASALRPLCDGSADAMRPHTDRIFLATSC
jgi:hypothetical protein